MTSARRVGLAVLATLFLGAGHAEAQVYRTQTAFGGSGNGPAMNAPWSVGGAASASCSTPGGGLTSLYHTWVFLGAVAGFTGAIPTPSGFEPRVMFNYQTGPYAFMGATAPALTVMMHPGPTGTCAVLRLTIPANMGGYYSVFGAFFPAMTGTSTGQGDGALGMILVNGNAVAAPVDTMAGAGRRYAPRIRLCPGSRVDFAVHMKSGSVDDETALIGEVRRVASVNYWECRSRLPDPRLPDTGTLVMPPVN